MHKKTADELSAVESCTKIRDIAQNVLFDVLNSVGLQV